jgi:tRNA pseudouridine55 synthase
MHCGILLLDKPHGMSSNSATLRVRRLLGATKAGHVGTLDPLATGMLPVCVGEATKVAGDILWGAKHYRFTIALGAQTATGDLEGEVIERAPVPPLSAEAIAGALRARVGSQPQTPPMYSAVKQQGQPLYRLARRGITVERSARQIEIHELICLRADAVTIECEVRCGAGTYVRVLAEDIARDLGTCGHVAALRRLAVEPFAEREMLAFEEIERRQAAGRPVPLVAAELALAHMPCVELSLEATRRLRHGQAVEAPGNLRGRVRVFGEGRQFLGLGEADGQGQLKPKRLFLNAV